MSDTTALTFSVTIGNNQAVTSQDKDAAMGVVKNQNSIHEALNAADPPPDPLYPIYPTTPQSELLSSYQMCLGLYTLVSAHQSYADQYAAKIADQGDLKERWRISNDAQRVAAANQLEPLP